MPRTRDEDQIHIIISQRLRHACWLASAGGGVEWPTHQAAAGLPIAQPPPTSGLPLVLSLVLYAALYPWIPHCSPPLVFQWGCVFTRILSFLGICYGRDILQHLEMELCKKLYNLRTSNPLLGIHPKEVIKSKALTTKSFVTVTFILKTYIQLGGISKVNGDVFP